MDEFSVRVARAVQEFRSVRGLEVDELACLLFVAPSTLKSKLYGARRWSVGDLRKLAEIGVKLPPLHEPRKGRV